MAASAPVRMNGPSGSWLVRVARRAAMSTPPCTAASASPRNVPVSSACELVQLSARPMLAASLASFLNQAAAHGRGPAAFRRKDSK